MVTIREALNALLSCDNDFAAEENGVGFNGLDTHFAHNMAAVNYWTDRQQQAVLKMLRKYQGQLARYHNIEYSQLQKEQTREEFYAARAAQPQVASLDFDGQKLILKSPFSFKDAAKAIPHRHWDADAKCWTYKADAEVLQAFQQHIQAGTVQITPAVQPLYDALAAREAQKDAAAKIKAGDAPAIPVPLKTTPMAHQRKAFAIASTLDNSALLMEQGTGKTLVAIATMGFRYQQQQITRCLVFAPVTVLPVWKRQILQHAAFPVNVVTLNRGTVAQKAALVQGWKDVPGTLGVIVVNYESAWREGLAEALMAWVQGQMCVADESQKIKHHTSTQSKYLHKIGQAARFKQVLTGTPVTQNPLDVFSQYKFLDVGIFGSSFTNFRNQYCIMGGFQNHQIVGYRDLGRLAAKAHSIAFRCTKEECLDLPSTTDQFMYCQLTPATRALYQQMQKEALVKIEGQVVDSPIVITQLLRLHQITGGFLPIHDEADPSKILEYKQVSTEKLDLLKQVLEDLPQDKKVVIFCRFTPEIKACAQVASQLGKQVLTLSGATPAAQRGSICDRFQNDPSINAIVVQIATGGSGIDLFAAPYMVFYSLDFSWANYDQAKARVHRMGQTQNVTYIHLLAENTIDERIQEALAKKGNVAKLVVDDMKGLNEGNWQEAASALIQAAQDGQDGQDEGEGLPLA
jgi:SNF2 family DNA or RNA helicase